jgi:hypothetical protein
MLIAWLAMGTLACAGVRVGDDSECERRLPTHPEWLVEAANTAGPSTSRPAEVVVLVALDGVRWQEIANGVDPTLGREVGRRPATARRLMPNLHSLATSEGAGFAADLGPNGFFASGPRYVSLPGYIEMLTGRYDTACTSNDCEGTRWPTLADEFADAPGGAAVVASWPTLERAVARRTNVLVSAGRHGCTGDMGPRAHRTWLSAKDASPAPGFGDYRPDPLTAAVALDVLRESRPSFLFVGLGDTDEYAHHRDYAGYLRALEHADSVIGAIDDELATLRRRGVDTLLVVTTDHGRSKSFADHGDDPESSRVWLVAAGEAVRSRGWQAPTAPRHLADIAPTVHALAGRAPSPTHQGRPIPELLAPRRTTLASADRSSRMNEERTWP